MNKQTLIIRADANERMGTGHIMRCIALAQEWVKQKGTIEFICCLSNNTLLQKLQSLDFGVCPIEKSCPDPLDITTTLLKATQKKAAAVVVDGYHFTPGYHEKIRAEKNRLMVIDDYNHLPFYHADILLNQNMETNTIPYNTLPGTIKLLGSDFILLRDEFLSVKRQPVQKTGGATNILVTMGGSDPDNVTLKVVRALNLISAGKLKIKIVLGPGNLHRESVNGQAKGSIHDIQVIFNTPNMPGLMAWADMAVCAGGGTAWELLYFNIPSVFLVIADNQEKAVRHIAKANAGISAGRHDIVSLKEMAQKIRWLIEDESARKTIIHNCQSLIDGKGRARVVSALMPG